MNFRSQDSGGSDRLDAQVGNLGHGTPVGNRRHGAFSLAELMIALVILGLGLLFIAAALPVGMDYVRESTNLELGQAAADEALDQIELSMHTCLRLLSPDPAVSKDQFNIKLVNRQRLDGIFRPRNPSGALAPLVPWVARDDYEPFIKLRPLPMRNIAMPVGSINLDESAEFLENGMTIGSNSLITGTIGAYLSNVLGSGGVTLLECDTDPNLVGAFQFVNGTPSLASLARVYPAITPVMPFTVNPLLSAKPGDFLGNTFDQSLCIQNSGATGDYLAYCARRLNYTGTADWGTLPQERAKAVDRKLVWSAFYRRVSYDKLGPGPNGSFDSTAPNDDIRTASDPLTYEVIVVVARRNNPQDRFPRQDLTRSLSSFYAPAALDPSIGLPAADTQDTLAPIPWLVMFDPNQLNCLPLATVAKGDYLGTDINNRALLNTSNLANAARVTFRCSAELGALLPVGSYLFPAANDNFPFNEIPRGSVPLTTNCPTPGARVAGFVPHSPDSLPIYRVIDRPDPTTVVVENNGSFPWLATDNAADARFWPVWVIPPAFTARGATYGTATNQPVYDKRSPIVAVSRRVIKVHQIQ